MSEILSNIVPNFASLLDMIDYRKPSFQLAVLFIFGCPTFWNVVGIMERKFSMIRKLCGGSKYIACYMFALIVFSISARRNYLFYVALDDQPKLELDIDPFLINCLSGLLYLVGGTLVISSFLRLGVTGTYCGDYFGILMKERVKSFPFNLVEDPMYLGSFLNFAAAAVYKRSVAGMFLSILAYALYMMYSILLENPYTSKIYSGKR